MDLTVKYLLSLPSIRERARIVGEAASAGKLSHFDVHEERMVEVADFVTSIIERDYGPDKYNTIPPHGRWQHFAVGGKDRIANMIEIWKTENVDELEITRSIIDLFFVSVLLDAGAGDQWHFADKDMGETYERSEGIAVASLYMFKGREFQTDKDHKVPWVDGQGLEDLTTERLAHGFQVHPEHNPMLGIESRANLLRSLGTSLLSHPDIFGQQGRPGNVVDYMLRTSSGVSELDVLMLWDILQTVIIPIWPKDRTTVNGTPIGDAWPLSTLSSRSGASEASRAKDINPDCIQPFHKLTQWLTYSLMVPFQRILGKVWINADSLTALPEYRNGGLFVDLGVLTLKEEALTRGLDATGGGLPMFEAGDDVVVEWRAMTLVLIDRLYGMILERMGNVKLSMAQLLEAGTWKSGREIAAKMRPNTKSSPIVIRSDGTVF